MAEQEASTTPGPGRARPRGWPRWAPYAAVAWSLVYAAIGAYWAATGHGFPYAPGNMDPEVGPVVGKLGPGAAWAAVLLAGAPAALVGTAMLRGVRTGRRPLIAAGALLAVMLLLLMTDVGLLQLVGYAPYGVFGLLTGAEIGHAYLDSLLRWSTANQVLCLLGGFLWAAATIGYARRAGGACLSCGRRGSGGGWNGRRSAARWGRFAVYTAMAVPLFYALTRFAWALGIPLGISEGLLRRGQETGMWTSGAFLAAFGVVGAVLTLGLVQRWGEVFPRWMVGLAEKRVPIALAVVPASFVSVLMTVGGIAMWSGYAQMVSGSVTGSGGGMGVIGAAPTALFPVWGMALAAAALAYYYRRRGACPDCGRKEELPE
ncbi:MAG: hypothetical protein M0026_15205 [Nocardiopsaceae bacterium]|nr:hypothetical protein [Nocardiopsaceae bacterium]